MKTIVHLLRHGEVHNPQGMLYGRSTGFHLSERGSRMANRVADRIGDRDITHIVSSPLERAQETATPLRPRSGSRSQLDERVIESGNIFEGKPFNVRRLDPAHSPRSWTQLWNPFLPSWGEPYKQVVGRMWPAVHDAREPAAGHEAVIVSHQLPIWITRLTPRVARSCTTRASGTARCAASPRSPSTTTGWSASATPSRPVT